MIMDCCKHLEEFPNEQGHVLPCRDKICLSCVAAIEGLMEGKIFACPLCGNYSQYVDPRKAVLGEVMSTESRSGIDDYPSSKRSDVARAESEQADFHGSVAATELVSDGTEYGSQYDRTIRALIDGKGVQWEKMKIEQKEIWDEIEKDKHIPERSIYGQRVKTLESNDAASYSSQNAYYSNNKHTQNDSDCNRSTQRDAKLNKSTNVYNEEGLCLDHKMFITFSCNECDDLLCEECNSDHILKYPSHTVYRLSDLLEKGRGETVSNCNSDCRRDVTAIDFNNKECKIHIKPYLMYCERCQHMLCKKCYDEDHHQVCILGKPISLRNMEEQLKFKFEEHLREIDGIKNKSMEVSQTAAKNVASLHEVADALKKVVETTTKEAIEQLLENQRIMVNQIESELRQKTVKHEISAKTADEVVKSCNEIAETANSALKSVEDRYFDVAQVKEENVRRSVKDLDFKQHLHLKPQPNEPIGLQCVTDKIARYSIYDDKYSKAPIRLCKQTKSWSTSPYSTPYASASFTK